MHHAFMHTINSKKYILKKIVLIFAKIVLKCLSQGCANFEQPLNVWDHVHVNSSYLSKSNSLLLLPKRITAMVTIVCNKKELYNQHYWFPVSLTHEQHISKLSSEEPILRC